VQDLLDNARNEQRIPLRPAYANLNEIVKEQIDHFELVAKQKSIQVLTDFSQDDLTVYVDSRRFGQVIANLISNAIKYSPAQSTITVHVFNQGDQALVQVVDSGYGIPAQDLPFVFEKYYRVQRAEHLASEGTGMGLPIAKMIVEEHGGTLTAQSELGSGSVFTITLPLTSNEPG